MQTTETRYTDVILAIQDTLSPFNPKELNFSELAITYKVGKQLLNVLVEHRYITKVKSNFYILEPAMYDLTGAQLQGLAQNYFRQSYYQRKYLNDAKQKSRFIRSQRNSTGKTTSKAPGGGAGDQITD